MDVGKGSEEEGCYIPTTAAAAVATDAVTTVDV